MDYLFINHTSFLQEDKQVEFRNATGVQLPHYDILVVLDSYYNEALDQVDHVEYYLSQSYEEAIQVRSNSKNHFLLKELATSEFVLSAKVFLNDVSMPLILTRYITLWKDGPGTP